MQLSEKTPILFLVKHQDMGCVKLKRAPLFLVMQERHTRDTAFERFGRESAQVGHASVVSRAMSWHVGVIDAG